MKASRFFGVFAPAVYILEKHKLGKHYALIGGYGCKYWYKYYSNKYIRNLKSADIDFRGNLDPVALTLKRCWPAKLVKDDIHKDNPDSVTYKLIQKFNKAKAEVIKLVPTLDRDSPISQGIAYRVPCKYDENLTVSVLDPCSLFVSKLPAYQDLERRTRKDKKGQLMKHDGEHLILLAAVIPHFLKDAESMRQSQSPQRDPKVAANRLVDALTQPDKDGKLPELPKQIDRESLLKPLKEFAAPEQATRYEMDMEF